MKLHIRQKRSDYDTRLKFEQKLFLKNLQIILKINYYYDSKQVKKIKKILSQMNCSTVIRLTTDH